MRRVIAREHPDVEQPAPPNQRPLASVLHDAWSAASAHSPVTFKLYSGQALTLPPGLVWIDVVA